MIGFQEIYHKSLLKEKIAWKQSLSKLLFDTRERFLLRDIKIPLSTPIQKRIWPETPRTTVFHLTDPDGVNALIKIGYKPQGGVSSGDGYTYQALYREDYPLK